jgi:esterase/lipase
MLFRKIIILCNPNHPKGWGISLNKMQMTIEECIEYITNKEFNEFMKEIIEIEDKNQRIEKYSQLFKKEIAQV